MHTHRALDDARLQSLGVFDGNHRRSILHRAQAGADADLDNVLTDLTSVIADLEAFTVVSRVIGHMIITCVLAFKSSWVYMYVYVHCTCSGTFQKWPN